MLSDLSASWFAVRPPTVGTRAHGGWCAQHTAPAAFSVRHDGRYAGTRGSHDPPTLHRGTSPAVHATRSVAPGFSTDGREHSTARTRTTVSLSPLGSDGAGQPVQSPPPPASPAIQRPPCSMALLWVPQPNHDQPDRTVSSIVGKVSRRSRVARRGPSTQYEMERIACETRDDGG